MAEVDTCSGFRVYKYYNNKDSYHRNHLRRRRNEYVVEALFGTNEQALPNSKTRKLLKKLNALQEISDKLFQRVRLEPDVLESFKNVLGPSFDHGTIDHESFLNSEKSSHFKLIKLLFETVSGNYDRILDLENQLQSLTDENTSLNAYVSDVQDEMAKLRKFASDCNEMRVSELGIQSEEYQMLYEKYSNLQDEMRSILQKNYKLEKQMSKIVENEREDGRALVEVSREDETMDIEQFAQSYGIDLFEPILDESNFQMISEEYEKRIEELRKSNNKLFDENMELRRISKESFGAEKFVTLSLLFNQITKTHNKLFQDQNEVERVRRDTESYERLSLVLNEARINTLEYENRTYKEKLVELEEMLKMEVVGRFSLESIVSQLKMELHQSHQVYLKLESLNASVLTNGHELDLVKTNRDVLSEQLSRMKHMFTNLTKEKHELASKVFELEYTKDTLLKELDVLKDQVRKVEKLLMNKEEDRLDFRDKITNIQLEANAKILEDKLIRMKIQNDELKLEITNLTTNMADLKSNLERERRENSELMKKVSVSLKNESKLTAEMQQIVNELNGLKASLETGAVNLRNMSNDMGLMNRKLFEKDLQMSALEAKKDMVTSVLTEFATKLSRSRLTSVNLEELRRIDVKSLNYNELIQLLTGGSGYGVNSGVLSSAASNSVSFSIGAQNSVLNPGSLNVSNSTMGGITSLSTVAPGNQALSEKGLSYNQSLGSEVFGNAAENGGLGGPLVSKRSINSTTVLEEGMEEHLMRDLMNLIRFNEFLTVLCVNLAKQLGTLTNNMLNVTNFSNIYETFKMELVDVDAFKSECMVKINDLENKIVSLDRLNSDLEQKHVWERSIVRLKEKYEKSLANYKMMLKECRHLLKLNETALDSLRSENGRLLSDCSGAANVMIEYESKLSEATNELLQLKELIFTVLPTELKMSSTRETPIKSIELLTSYLNNISILEATNSNINDYASYSNINNYGGGNNNRINDYGSRAGNLNCANGNNNLNSGSNVNNQVNESDNVSVANRGISQQYDQKMEGQNGSSSSSARSDHVDGGREKELRSGNGENYDHNKEALMEKEQLLSDKEQKLNDIYEDVNYYCRLIVNEIKAQMNTDKQIDTDYESTTSNHELGSDDTVSDCKDEDYVVDRFEEILNLLDRLYYYRNHQSSRYGKRVTESYGSAETSTMVLDMNVIKSINKFAGTLKRYYSTYNKSNVFVLDDLEYQFESIPTIMDNELKFKTFTVNLTKLMNLAGDFIYEQLTENSDNMSQMMKQLHENSEVIQNLEHMNMLKEQQVKSTQYELNELKLQCDQLQQMYISEKSHSKQVDESMSRYEGEVSRLREELEEISKKNEKLLLLVKEYQQIVKLLKS